MQLDSLLHDFSFTDEEKYLLNHFALDKTFSECLEQISFGSTVCSDEDVETALDSLFSKLADFSSEQWELLQSYLPLDVSYTNDDFDLSELEEK